MEKFEDKNNGYEVREKLIGRGFDADIVEEFMETYVGERYEYVEDYVWMIEGFIERKRIEADRPAGLE